MSYGKIGFTEEELKLMIGAISHIRKESFKLFCITEGKEKGFHQSNCEKFDSLLHKLDQPFINDKSQDAEEE